MIPCGNTPASIQFVSGARSRYDKCVNTKDILAKIEATESPLARQLLTAGLITRMLEDQGKSAPVLIGGSSGE